jgi:hypothetical protein
MNPLEKLKLFVMSGRSYQGPLREKYQKTYDLWEMVWLQTFKEIAGTSDLASDNFTRQDEILSLFWEDQCCAMVCHRLVDLSVKAFERDSYFRFWGWSEEAMAKLKAQGPRVALGSQITIHPDFRKMQLGGQVKEVIIGLSLRSFQDRNMDAVAGMMRNDKGLDRLFYESGAFPIVKQVTSKNFKLDFVAFFPKLRPIQVDPQFKVLVDDIWSKRQTDKQERNEDGNRIQELYAKVG